jgi:hypothetical protein
MAARRVDYDVKCMLCSTEVGQVVSGKFEQHAGCPMSVPLKGGLPRCCHCGGSLYFDPLDIYASPLDRTLFAPPLTGEVASTPSA